ncbi:WD40/YVTN/BNR-like repeat-containing protein [Terriglobus sp.]|uniref:WD40/YVTN/BNR-like repeat-containing protein n=1 Tax=Terriglobus sp. TaxID=1889013 RepID=UPI003AFFF07F
MKSLLRLCLSCSLAVSACTAASSQTNWLPFGPDGGDARAFAADPSDHNHVYLGSLTGTIYDTHDGGHTWNRLARVGKRDDLALDNIVVDPKNPKHILVGAWVLDRADGGLYVSEDGGKTWTSNAQMKGHSVRAMTMAPSDPNTIVIGALDGVFRTTDGGTSWTLISPAGNGEIHEVESIAIDPKDPRTIYAGTWHLPWKTTDGGEHWASMHQGIIDDSDVFSIIVDPSDAAKVYLSACSGIYRSTDAGAQFAKVQGIPSSARRTRVLMEDGKQTNVVFAGTTEGLWRTADSGHTFERNGSSSWIINDVNVDPTDSNHVMLATDRTGVLVSSDGGKTFESANKGFSSRQISAVTQDPKNDSKLYVGVLNDKAAGGVFTSDDGGQNWQQQSAGLNGADVFSLGETPGGTVLAGTRHGIYRMADGMWKPSGLTLALPPEEEDRAVKPATVVRKSSAARDRAGSNAAQAGRTRQRTSSVAPVKSGKRSLSVSSAPVRNVPPQESSTGVYALANNDERVFAATEEGLLYSGDEGKTWNRIRSLNGIGWRFVAAQGPRVAVANLKQISLSTDKGVNFHPITIPTELTQLAAVAVDNNGHIWAGGREGIFLSEDDGATWHTQKGLFVPNISGIYYDAKGQRVLVTSYQPGTVVFAVNEPDMSVKYWDSGWHLRQARPVGDHLVGVTDYDGMVLEPRMVASREK